MITGPLYQRGLTLIPACINDHMPNNFCDEIAYPLPNFNGWTLIFWERIGNFIPHSKMDVSTYPCYD